MSESRQLIPTEHGHVHLRTAGTGGVPIVLLHGGLASGRVYRPLARQLEADRVVVMPDRLGFGDSDPPPRRLAFEEYTRATLDALDGIGLEQFDVFGIHTGSIEGIELATAYPDRVRRLAIVEVPAFSAEDVREFKDHYVEHPAPVEDGSHLRWYWDWWAKGGYSGGAPRPRGRPPERIQEWVIDHLTALPDFWWAYHAAIEYPTGDRVRRVTQPLLVFSTHDDLAEQTRRALPTLPPQAEVVDLPHFADILRFYEWAPDDTAEVLGHLRRFLA